VGDNRHVPTRGSAATRGRRRLGSLIARGAVAACALAAGAGVGIALAASGGLDPSFGTSGTTVLERPTATYPTPTVLTSSGKIVVVTTSLPGPNSVITVSRLLANGEPDPTFDGDGKAVIESEGVPSVRAVAIQPDGKIVLVGFKNVGTTEADAVVWRLKADGGSGAVNGALDPSFGTGGAVAISTGVDAFADAVAIRPDGKIVVAGTFFEKGGTNEVAVWRLTSSGGLDNGFDTDGIAAVSDTKEDAVNAIALQPDGKILVAGTTTLATHPRDAVVWRLKENGGSGALNGALDTTFDTDGQADIDAGGDDTANAVAVQPDGKIVLAGRSEVSPGHFDAMVWRLKADGGTGATNGALDTTFGTTGAAAIDGGPGVTEVGASALALQPDGKILAAGFTRGGPKPEGAVLWRLVSGGGNGAVDSALDPAFGTGGVTRVDAGGVGAGADALALSPDRRVVVAGPTLKENLLVFRALGDPFAVNVVKAGSGAGSVQSVPAGIECGGACLQAFDDGSSVSLEAAPSSGSTFAGWSSTGCAGTGPCGLTMTTDQTVTATFNALPPPGSPPPPPAAARFILRTSALGITAFKRNARSVTFVVGGLPPGTRIAAKLLAGRITLAAARATAASNGRARVTFRFSKAARRRLRSAKLKRVTLKVTATLAGGGVSSASKSLKLKG
jgi:uncharacterized delta-60 repeat protein